MVSMERSPAAQPTSDETNAERLAPKDVSRKLRRFMENLLLASAEPPEEKAVRRSRILLRRGQIANQDVTKSDGAAVVLQAERQFFRLRFIGRLDSVLGSALG